ncbi:MAG: hypothetical protein M3380_16980, partial [Chloroflexota bacterium]|nr:hypothetical protein [Chloroflexota bacterium]
MQGPISFSTTVPRQAEARRLPRSIVLLPALGALILGILVYQLPARSTVAIGSPGDRLFIASSQALDATPEAEGSWYADELGDGGRSRWTRSRARITFAGAGGGDAEVTLRAQGWPAGVTRNEPRQPVVTVRAGGSSPDMVVGQFTPTPEWQEYGFSVPATARASADLVIELQASATFTSTQQF